MSRVTLRIVPFLMVCYFISFLDRVNLGFAALQMVKDLHFSATVFGFGGRHFLRVVLPVRSAEQPAPREVRRPPVDRADHDHVGSAGRRHGVGHGSALALSRAVSTGGRRSRIFSRRDSLSHLLVSGGVPCPDRRAVHGGDSGLELSRIADLGSAARNRRMARAAWLAVDVHPRGCAGRAARPGVPVRPQRPAGRRALARGRRAPLAAGEAPGAKPANSARWDS